LDKRQVFTVEVIIGQGREEIARLEAEMETEEKQLAQEERRLSELANELELAWAQAKSSIARAENAAQSANKKRLQLQDNCQILKDRLARERIKISKREEQLEVYRRYRKFLATLAPDGHSCEEFFQDSGWVLGELDRAHQENLLLLRESDAIDEEREAHLDRIGETMAVTEDGLAEMRSRHDGLPTLEEFTETLTEGTIKRSDKLESELSRLRKIVAHSHQKCLGEGGGMPALLMLERIEKGLEDLYDRLSRVKPQFAEAKMKKRDELRLEQHKAAVAAKKAADQRLKYDQAVERAQMPIKKPTGRPPVKRMLPVTVTRADPDKEDAENRERERIEKLLYGAEE
jgi:hypothetical protein